jgi:1-acyl-sn-glycerol-3-phosphate acyltransferase
MTDGDASMQAGFAGILRVSVNRIRTVYEVAVLYAGLLCFALMGLVWSLPAAVLHYALPSRAGERLGQYVIMAGFRAFLAVVRAAGAIRYDLSALDALRDERALVITTNHPSLIDIVLIASRLPRTVCIMKADLLNNPLLGMGARLAGYISNDSPWSMIRRSVTSVQSGSQLLIFPEGTRTETPPLSPFKEGFGMIAQRAGAPVQTLFIETNSPFLGKGWPLLKRPAFPLEYRVRLGRRFEVNAGTKDFVHELERYYGQELRAARVERGA